MHNSIKRTEKEIQEHMDFIQNEIKTRVGTYSELQEQILCLRAIYDACYGALKLPDFDVSNVSDGARGNTESDKYYRDTCYWLAGKLFKAPNCDPKHDAEIAKKLNVPNLKVVK